MPHALPPHLDPVSRNYRSRISKKSSGPVHPVLRSEVSFAATTSPLSFAHKEAACVWQGFRWEWVTPHLSSRTPSPATQCKNSEGRQLRVLPANPSFPPTPPSKELFYTVCLFPSFWMARSPDPFSCGCILLRREGARAESSRTDCAGQQRFLWTRGQGPITEVSTCYLKVF